MSNSQGSYPVTTENQMKAYDKLPPSARKALQEAVFDYACPPIVTKWRNGRKGFKTGKDLALRVAEWDNKRLAKKQK